MSASNSRLINELHDSGVQVQAVLPGATRTRFWDRARASVDVLPSEIVMGAEDCVDAALAGLDRHELVTIPALADLKPRQIAI
jgi:short-subunit dehydrogenase